MTQPHFSIILPARNAATTLPETISSVIAQTLDDFELILIDDGSTDDTLAIMIAAAARDPRIAVKAVSGIGVAAVRNMGVLLARGALIAFLDADDIWRADKLAHHARRHAETDQPDASYGIVAFMPAEGSTTARSTLSTVVQEPLGAAHAVAENPVCTMSNLVVTRSAMTRVGGFRPRMNHAEDQEWLVRAVVSGLRVVGIAAILVDYRTSLGGLSSNLRRMHAGWRRFARNYSDRIDLRASEAIYCRYLSRRALRLGAPPIQALRYALRGIASRPSAFFADRRRGTLTVVSACLSCLLPARVRVLLFA